MTIETTDTFVKILGNGSTTVFEYDFVGDAAEYIFVFFTDATNNTILIDPSAYTLVMNAPPPGGLWGIGGTVTYPIAGSPIPDGTSLTIQRILPLTQTTQVRNQGNFYPVVVEREFDTLEMQIQQLSNGGFMPIPEPIPVGGGPNIPIGMVTPYAGSTAPSGWLLCYGQSVSVTTYALLFAVIGYTYDGSGDNFGIPDMRGNLAAGRDDMGGTAANRITTAGCGIDGISLGASGGSQALQQHMHTATASITDPGHTHVLDLAATGTGGGFALNTPGPPVGTQGATESATTGISATITVNNTGSGSSQNVQPTFVLNYIIYTGNGGGTNLPIYDMVQFYPGLPADAAVLSNLIMVRNVTLPQNFSGAYASALSNATAQTVLTVNQNGSPVGTITFASGSNTGVFASSTPVLLLTGDILSIVNQATADATLANISVSITGNESN